VPLLLVLALLGGPAASRIRGEEIHVYAAASLSESLAEAAAGWEQASGHEVVVNLGASNDLARQIRAGAPADVFFSADVAQMDGLQQDGLVRAGDRVDLLSNTLVVVVPAASAARVAAPADLLAFPALALADPEAVPAGVYARKWLEAAGLWARLEKRVVPALNVRAALSMVESEHAPVGIVYKTDAAISKRVRVVYEVPRKDGPPIVYPVATVATSKRAALAASFVAHLRSAASLAVFTRFGFLAIGGQ
jgi:molybdate transport system substrate-binding protein